MKPERFWDGKTVHVIELPDPDRRNVEIAVTPETAHQLALVLRQANGIGNPIVLPEGVAELMTALDYVLVADPVSVAAHKRMEAGKGMTPDGGYKFPEPPQPSDPTPPAPPWVELRRRIEAKGTLPPLPANRRSHGSLAQDGE